MRILISGSSGFLARGLIPALQTDGHEIVRLVRRSAPGRAGVVSWDPDSGVAEPRELEGIGAVVHLAGESIAAGLWTAARKARIRNSRVRGTSRLVEALRELDAKPEVLLSASAIGVYGNRGDEPLDEGSSPGTGFLAEVCRDWEEAAAPAREAGIRVVHPRFGIILGRDGGALAAMLRPFRLGLGGPLGDGRHFMSWIAREDAVAACRHLLRSEDDGPVNVVAPNPVTNREFTRTLGRVLKRPTVLPVPAFLLRALPGGMADETFLASQRVTPARLSAAGFDFRFPRLEEALRGELGG